MGFYASNNNLEGEIPRTIGNNPKLEVIILHDNNLSGPIPRELANLTLDVEHDEYIDLSRNNFSCYESELINLCERSIKVDQAGFPSWEEFCSDFAGVCSDDSEIWLEAECQTIGSEWQVNNDSEEASNEIYISTSDNN